MELLSPAGSLRKLKYAVMFGADAVYTSGKNFGLRSKSTNLSDQELADAVRFTHSHSKKIYITVNIFTRNSDIELLPEYLTFLQKIDVDALIISDPAIFNLAKEHAPGIPIHISTQANVTSWKAAEFWYSLGAKRIILARELSISEISGIKRKNPLLEIEMFVHGAMCMSYSGRCLLSSFLNDRSANKGNCTQPCRWKYHLVEETRKGEFFPVEEDEHGTYIMNSKDLCLFDRLQEINDAGVDSIKIEGRMKSLYYVSNLTRVYREAIESIKNNRIPDPELRRELDKVSHRHYSQGFFDGSNSGNMQFYENSSYLRKYQFMGYITGSEDDLIHISVHSKFCLGEKLEFIFPDRSSDFSVEVDIILDEDNQEIGFTKPNTTVKILVEGLKEKNLTGCIIRKFIG